MLALSTMAGVLLRSAETNVSHKSVAEVVVRFTATVGVCGARRAGQAINAGYTVSEWTHQSIMSDNFYFRSIYY